MRNPNRHTGRSIFSKVLAPLFVALAAVFAGGCESPKDSDGTDFNAILLPTDLVVNLACAEVGVGFEQCVLEDPENPFVLVATPEFNPNNPDGFTKFDLAANIPAGPTGAKARYYLWATALARSPSGENQWYTAQARHE